MAERPLDRLLPGAVALVFGTGALAAGLGGIAADVALGSPSATSGIGFVLMLPLAVFAAVIGFAIGYGAGAWMKRRGLNASVPMRPYRLVMAFVLGLAIVIGATFGARAVVRHERALRPRVITGADALFRDAGAIEGCNSVPAVEVCDLQSGVRTGSLLWNDHEVSMTCESGRIRIDDAAGAGVASTALPKGAHVQGILATVVKQPQGREALAVLAELDPSHRRYLFTVFEADGRAIYQELFAGGKPQGVAGALYACDAEERGGVVVDLGSPVTYRPR